MSATSSYSSGSPGALVVDVEQLLREAVEVVDRPRLRHRGDRGRVHVPVRRDDQDRPRPRHRPAERPPGLGVPVLLQRVHRVAVAEERGGHDGHGPSPCRRRRSSRPATGPRRGQRALPGQPGAASGAAPAAASGRPAPRAAADVAGVGQRAAVERQAAAADARRQPVPQPGQRGDLLVEPVPPALGQPRPVAAVGGRPGGRVSSAARISGSESPTLRAARMTASRRSTLRGYRRAPPAVARSWRSAPAPRSSAAPTAPSPTARPPRRSPAVPRRPP